MKFHKKGAEAELFESKLDGNKVMVKKRVPKSYRNKVLDDSIRKKRTRSEAKLIRTAGLEVRTPHVLKVNESEMEIVMEFIEGKRLKEVIESKKELATLAGKEIRKIHEMGIVHGDLTTSNIIHNNNELVFIDFGLGFFSNKLEDKATDLIVFKKTFNATHSSLKDGWERVMDGYKPDKAMTEKMAAIEKRARYH